MTHVAQDRLQISRRVDWRFLLPHPNLGRVVHICPMDSDLTQALHLFSQSLTVLPSLAEPPPPDPVYDLAVLEQPAMEALHLATRLLGPAGVLYIEAYGLLGYLRHQRTNHVHELHPCRRPWSRTFSHTPDKYLRALGRLGFQDRQAYWYWPSFESCTKIVPVDSPAALQFAVTQDGDHRKGRLLAWLGNARLPRALLLRTAPCVGIVAQRDSL